MVFTASWVREFVDYLVGESGCGCGVDRVFGVGQGEGQVANEVHKQGTTLA